MSSGRSACGSDGGTMGNIDEHLMELAIARTPRDPRWALPELRSTDSRVLDVGCGVGQALVALGCTDRRSVGMDIDESAIRYGIGHFGGQIQYVLADARRIPMPSETFDLVFCRSALAYMQVIPALREMRRVLRPGGRLWVTLHTRPMATTALRAALRARSPRRTLHALYVLFNGYLLRWLGTTLPYLTGRRESWQSPDHLARRLHRWGLRTRVTQVGPSVVLEADRP